jgi:hypothetical protein
MAPVTRWPSWQQSPRGWASYAVKLDSSDIGSATGFLRVHEFGPRRIPDPQRTSTAGAEVAPGAAGVCCGAVVVGQLGAVDAQIALAGHLHAARDGAEVDGVAAASRGLAAYRAIAAHERNRLLRLDREPDFAAMARAFQMHAALLGLGWRSSDDRRRARLHRYETAFSYGPLILSPRPRRPHYMPSSTRLVAPSAARAQAS